jgi:hypothetical protein
MKALKRTIFEESSKMKHLIMRLTLFVLAIGLSFQQHAEAQNKISNSVFGNGGHNTANPSFSIAGTVGQPITGETSNESNIGHSGFWYQTIDIVTSVEQIPSALMPKEFRLEQNYPNPFNPTTTIKFALPQSSAVTLKLYDILGRDVATLVDNELEAGEHKVIFDAKDLASGIYFYQIQAEDFVQAKKLTLLK